MFMIYADVCEGTDASSRIRAARAQREAAVVDVDAGGAIAGALP